MQEWLDLHGWTVDEIGLVLAVLSLLGAMVLTVWRVGATRVRQALRLGLGLPDRRYADWFVRTWGRYENPYLRGIEHLDLDGMYVSLMFMDAGTDKRVSATQVLRDRSTNIIIEGDAGTGKSTLMRAYGVAALRARSAGRASWGADRAVPFLVVLRRFAAAEPGSGLAEYLINTILVSGAGMTPANACEYLLYLLVKGRVVVLLDGVDEIPAARQDAVLRAVQQFKEDGNPALPTSRARLVVTCRRQNLLTLRERWAPVVAAGEDEERSMVYTLARLRDSEIFAYLIRLRDKFHDRVHGPSAFMQAISNAGTLEMHRVPLVLSMSVGLYAEKTSFEVPNEIADLYSQMVDEMLKRHLFAKDPGTSLLTYTVADKTRFLREFALANAKGEDDGGQTFGEFARPALYAFAAKLAPSLDTVDKPDKFVNEIVEHSGLVTKLDNEGRTCIFAHRSIQEHFVAEQLRQFDPNGAEYLLGRANDPDWRQVVLFYTGTDRHNQQAIDTFLTRLSESDLALAGQCLAGAKATNEVAQEILWRIADRIRAEDDVAVHLSGLLAATLSPRLHIRKTATDLVNLLLTDIIGRPDVYQVLGGELDGVVRVLEALARTRAERVATLAPKIAAAAPDDARLVGPLWQCLSAPAMVDQADTGKIVERLLTLVKERDCFQDLQRQQPTAPEFATPQLRRQVYPFHEGLDHDSNLVTLLCWAEHLDVAPTDPNRFIEARRADPVAFATVELDVTRTRRAVLFQPVRALSAIGAVTAVAGSAYVLLTDWRVLTRPDGWHSLWWMLLPLLLAPTILLTLTGWAERRPPDTAAARYLKAGTAPGSGNSANVPAELFARYLPNTVAQFALLVSPLTYSIALAPLLTVSVPFYLLAATLLQLAGVWVGFLALFDRGVQIYLRRPNPYVDMYDHQHSRHWIVPDA